MPKKKKKDKTIVISSRKAEHVSLVATQDVSHRRLHTGFDDLRFEHNALPELSLDEIDTSTQFLGKHLDAPILISSMTGGYEGAEELNRVFARVAKEYCLAIGVGSARQALENKKYHKSFSVVRKEYPGGLVFTNIGGAEVAKLYSQNKLNDILRIIDLVEADAIVVHLNPLQELMQPEGSRDFRGILGGIEALCKQFTIPVIVKEVGAGISKSAARILVTHGVLAVDIAGAGGTSWAGVEILRQDESKRGDLDIFWDWGIPTVEALQAVKELKQTMTFGLIASGGIRTGLEAAKAIALGADLVGFGQPIVKAYTESGEEGLFAMMQTVISQLRIAMLLSGSKTITQLGDQVLFPIKN